MVSATKKITTETSDQSQVKTHNLKATVAYQDFSGVTPGTINFSIVVDDPCATATINLSPVAGPVIPNTSPSYEIGAAQDVQTFDFAKAYSGSTSNCPTIEFKIVDADDVSKPEIHLSSATSGIFTFDSANSELKTLSTDHTKAGTYNLEIQARFSGGSPAYSWENTQNGAITFTVTSIC